MRRLASLCLASAITLVSMSAIAAEDPILTRQKLMSAAGAAGGGVAVRMMREEIPFNPVVAASAIRTLNAVAYSYGDYFPEGSESGGETRARPEIWNNPEGFRQELDRFMQTTDAALEAEPEDLESFKAVMGPVMQTCGSCHDLFRMEN